MNFTGSAGSDSVSFIGTGSSFTGYIEPYGLGGPITTFGSTGSADLQDSGLSGLNGNASIDSVVTSGFPGQFPSFDVECCVAGGEFLEIFDPITHNLLATATLNGAIVDTGYQSGPGIFGGVNESGTFAIVPAPEPNSAIFLFMAAGVFGMYCGFRGMRAGRRLKPWCKLNSRHLTHRLAAELKPLPVVTAH